MWGRLSNKQQKGQEDQKLNKDAIVNKKINQAHEVFKKIINERSLELLDRAIFALDSKFVNFGELLLHAANSNNPCGISREEFFEWAFNICRWSTEFQNNIDFRNNKIDISRMIYRSQGVSILEYLINKNDLLLLQKVLIIYKKQDKKIDPVQLLLAAIILPHDSYKGDDTYNHFIYHNEILLYLLSQDNPYQEVITNILNSIETDKFEGTVHPITLATSLYNKEAIHILYKHDASYPEDFKLNYSPLSVSCMLNNRTDMLRFMISDDYPWQNLVLEKIRALEPFKLKSCKDPTLARASVMMEMNNMVIAGIFDQSFLSMQVMFDTQKYDHLITLFDAGALQSFSMLDSPISNELPFVILCCHKNINGKNIEKLKKILSSEENKNLLLDRMLEFVEIHSLSRCMLERCVDFIVDTGLISGQSARQSSPFFHLFHKECYSDFFKSHELHPHSKLVLLHEKLQQKTKLAFGLDFQYDAPQNQIDKKRDEEKDGYINEKFNNKRSFSFS